MNELLFSPPWWLPCGIVIAGAYLFWSGNRRSDATLRNLGLVVVALAAIFIVTAWLVDTPTETAVKKTRQLVSAVDKRDWPLFKSLLDDKTSFLFYFGKDQLTTGASTTADRIGLKYVHLLSLKAERHQSQITINLSCISEQDVSPYPTPTNWRFEWQNSGNGWYLAQVVPIPNASVSADDVEKRMAPVP
jgi:hypothetical protein